MKHPAKGISEPTTNSESIGVVENGRDLSLKT